MTIDSFSGPHRFLSNFYPVGGTTVEHWYQAAKTLDVGWQRRIRAAVTPEEAKWLGRQSPMRADWEVIKVPYMLALLRWKFQHPDLRRRLLETGQALLVEGNTWGDQFWGVCDGRGQNWLGRLLMTVRAELQ